MGKLHDNVLVTDTDGYVGALSVLRSLGRRNVATTLLTQESLVPSLFSRWHPERVNCPSSFDDSPGFLMNLLRIVKTRRYITIFPMGDHSLILISQHRDRLMPYLKLALPSHESVMNALNKGNTLKMGEGIGIPTPQTFQARNIAEVKDISTKIQYPAVIKPKWSIVWKQNAKALYSRPSYVNSASELLSTYAKIDENFPAPLIQEYVPGYNISVALMFDRGEPKAACFIRVYRTMPITGGASVLRESIPPDPTLLRYASNLLKSMHWHGIAEVEFRVDSRDSTPKLMEINPRFWGSMNVAIESGVYFPHLLYLITKGEQIRPVFNYKIGVKFRQLNLDFQNLGLTLKGEPKLINTKSPNKLNAVLRFLKFYEKNMHYDGFTLFDPLPFFKGEADFAYGTTKNMIPRKRLRIQHSAKARARWYSDT